MAGRFKIRRCDIFIAADVLICDIVVASLTQKQREKLETI